ncbi:hypothetical protein [Shewanella sp. 125m-1]
MSDSCYQYCCESRVHNHAKYCFHCGQSQQAQQEPIVTLNAIVVNSINNIDVKAETTTESASEIVVCEQLSCASSQAPTAEPIKAASPRKSPAQMPQSVVNYDKTCFSA